MNLKQLTKAQCETRDISKRVRKLVKDLLTFFEDKHETYYKVLKIVQEFGAFEEIDYLIDRAIRQNPDYWLNFDSPTPAEWWSTEINTPTPQNSPFVTPQKQAELSFFGAPQKDQKKLFETATQLSSRLSMLVRTLTPLEKELHITTLNKLTCMQCYLIRVEQSF